MSPEWVESEAVESHRLRKNRPADSDGTDVAARTAADGLTVSHRKIVQRRSLIALQRDAGNRAVTALLDRSSRRRGTATTDAPVAPIAQPTAQRTVTASPAVSIQREPPPTAAPPAPTAAPPAPTTSTAGGAPAAVDKAQAKQIASQIFDQHLGNPAVDTTAVEKKIEQGKKEGEFLIKAGVQSKPALAAVVQQAAGGTSGGGSAPAAAPPTTTPSAPTASTGGSAPAAAPPTTTPSAPTASTGGSAPAAAPPTTTPSAPTASTGGSAPAAAPPTTTPSAPATATAPGTAPHATAPSTTAATTAPGTTAAPAAPGTTAAPAAPGTTAAATAPAAKSGGFFSRLGNRIKGFFGFGKKSGEGYENVETTHTAIETTQNIVENAGSDLLGEGAKAAVEVGGHVLAFINVFKILFDAREAYKSHVAGQNLDEIAADIQRTSPASTELHEAVLEAAKAKYGERLERIRKVALSTISLVGGVTLFFTGMTLASNPVGWAILSVMAAAGLIYLIYRFFRWLVSEDPDKAKRDQLATTVLDSAAIGDTNGVKALEEILEVEEAQAVLAAYKSGSAKHKAKAVKRVSKHLGE